MLALYRHTTRFSRFAKILEKSRVRVRVRTSPLRSQLASVVQFAAYHSTLSMVVVCFLLLLFCGVRIVFMSSAYDSILIWGGGVRMSDVYMLKRTGDNTQPCGTPVFSSLF